MSVTEEPKYTCQDCEHYVPDEYNKPIFYCRYWHTTFGNPVICIGFKLGRDNNERNG